ncbi:MAG: hypothetical protein ACPLKS_08080 [Caldisericum exile]|uniref:hypothetical protein n=1 Tax=Caldisericum exile TaxID=693075 RepID=UPI003C718CD6
MKKILLLFLFYNNFIPNFNIYCTTANYSGPKPCTPPCCRLDKYGKYHYYCIEVNYFCTFLCRLECRIKVPPAGGEQTPISTFHKTCGESYWNTTICEYIGDLGETDANSACMDSQTFQGCVEESGFSGCYIMCYDIIANFEDLLECRPYHSIKSSKKTNIGKIIVINKI